MNVNYLYIKDSKKWENVICTYCGSVRRYGDQEMVYEYKNKKFCCYTCRAKYLTCTSVRRVR